MNPHSIPSIDSGRRPYFPCYAGDECHSPLSRVEPLLWAMVEQFRRSAWAEEGLENDELVLLSIARQWGWTRSKFYKLWPRARVFFSEIDGFLFFTDDERHRRKQAEISAKRRIAGALGGKRKYENWNLTSTERLAIASKPPPPPLSSSIPVGKEDTGEPRGLVCVENQPPPPNKPEEVSAQTQNHRDPQSLANASQEEAAVFRKHCTDLHLPPPGRKLWVKIKRKFAGAPMREIVEQLPKFENQTSPGLWDSLPLEDLLTEANRRRDPVPKKPAQPDGYTDIHELIRLGVIK